MFDWRNSTVNFAAPSARARTDSSPPTPTLALHAHVAHLAMANKKIVAYFYDDELGNFYYGPGHPMKPHRIRMAHNLVLAYGLYKQMEIYRPTLMTEHAMTRFHADDYIHFLKHVTPDNASVYAAELGKFNVDVDWSVQTQKASVQENKTTKESNVSRLCLSNACLLIQFCFCCVAWMRLVSSQSIDSSLRLDSVPSSTACFDSVKCHQAAVCAAPTS